MFGLPAVHGIMEEIDLNSKRLGGRLYLVIDIQDSGFDHALTMFLSRRSAAGSPVFFVSRLPVHQGDSLWREG